MKKIIILVAVVISFLVINKEEKIIVPKDSIRFRIIANSNSEEDQLIKKEVLKEVKRSLNKRAFNNIEDARDYYKSQIPSYNKIVKNTLERNNYIKQYNIKYGNNYFPKKKYKNIIYDEGEYESLVITIGDGIGENFWCVLFPPLCLVDENQKYPSIVKKVLEKYF